MKCPFRKRKIIYWILALFIADEEFLDCIGPECSAYIPAPKFDKILNPELVPKEDCRMMRK